MLIKESVSKSEIEKIIDSKVRVNIYYDGDYNTSKGKRYVEIYGLGLSKGGNIIIRAYQLFGDTDTENARWKTFRLDKITSLEPTKFKIFKPISDYDASIPKFNPNGDETMSTVYKLAKF